MEDAHVKLLRSLKSWKCQMNLTHINIIFIMYAPLEKKKMFPVITRDSWNIEYFWTIWEFGCLSKFIVLETLHELDLNKNMWNKSYIVCILIVCNSRVIWSTYAQKSARLRLLFIKWKATWSTLLKESCLYSNINIKIFMTITSSLRWALTFRLREKTF